MIDLRSPVYRCLVLAAIGLALAACGGDDIQSAASERPIYQIGYPANANAGPWAFSGDFLQAYAVAVTAPTHVIGFNLWMSALSGSTQGQVGLYADSGGVPGNLVVASGAVPLAVGPTTLPTAPTPVAPGNYWLVKRLSLSGSVTVDLSTSVSRGFLSYPFANPWPDPMPAMGTSSGPQVNLSALAVD